ncbi:hypothetical protein BC939DRAFT_475179 [Gamsiella multidivaricata]|uniref:uncharacterized protein n=1 Tax=Gamsiella multidivaricata TaxID=101098 RepID=UPI002220FC3C|nr:uncharacterized protein BC939DRAFT_475179 [Gamsiella multidivaricata]KAG0364339.1 hypothetical protein BGZ54_007615 [Gamsiella multidivaricata]KAI7827581.1 hypothetical protein BC939DRAFT_475179 [Gamsiella multidivaricata]
MSPPSGKGKDAKALLQKTIRSFLNCGGPPYLILDTRPRRIFCARHLSPSTNIPLHRLDGSWFKLPAKQTPFAVLESPQEDTTDGQDDEFKKLERSDPRADQFGRQIRSSNILKSRGYRTEWTFEDHPLFWTTFAEELSLSSMNRDPGQHTQPALEIIDGSKPSKERYNFLFQPNPILVKILPTVERELLASRSTQQAKSPHGSNLLRCLDVGCGAGRDMIYMVARSANGLAINGAEWSALGMDQREDMCGLGQQLVDDTFFQDPGEHIDAKITDPGMELATRVGFLVGKVDSESGVFWVSSPSSIPSHPQGKAGPLRLQNIRYHDVVLDQQQQQLLGSAAATETKDQRFDLIIMIRFLQRSLFAPLVENWLRPGGFIILSTFVSDKDLPQYSKPGPAHRLQSRSEASDIFESLGLNIVSEEVSLIEDGRRPVATVVARKP